MYVLHTLYIILLGDLHCSLLILLNVDAKI